MAIMMRPLLPWASASWTFERVGSWWDMLTSRGWWHHGWPRWPRWPCSPHRCPHLHHRPPLLHHLRRPPPLLPPQVCKGGHLCLQLSIFIDTCLGFMIGAEVSSMSPSLSLRGVITTVIKGTITVIIILTCDSIITTWVQWMLREQSEMEIRKKTFSTFIQIFYKSNIIPAQELMSVVL